jgi:6-phosphofructokinase 1
MSVAEDFGNEVKARAKEETLISDLTYELRSGEADFIDKLVASTFGNMAFDCVLAGQHGQMTAVENGCFAMVPIPDPKLGPRKVDVSTMYNTERYRPNYTNKVGWPIFLCRL